MRTLHIQINLEHPALQNHDLQVQIVTEALTSYLEPLKRGKPWTTPIWHKGNEIGSAAILKS